MHPTSVSKEVMMLLNMSKSSFFRSGDIIPEVEGENGNSYKNLVVRRRKSLSYEQLNHNSTKSNDLLGLPFKVPPPKKREISRTELKKPKQVSPKPQRVTNSRCP